MNNIFRFLCFCAFITFSSIIARSQNIIQSCDVITNGTSTYSGQNTQIISKEKVVLSSGFTYVPSTQTTTSLNVSVDPYKICDLENIIPEYNSQNPYQHDNTLPVGAIPGYASVSESGAAIYEIPIFAPKGTGTMQPNLSLVYNSQSGDGILGKGWSISGLSAIYCDNNNYEIDGFVESIKYDNPPYNSGRYINRFAMDGSRLVLKSGVYSSNNSEYRTANESFNKVLFVDNYFKCTAKDGEISYYGVTDNSKLKTNPTSSGFIYSWLIDKTVDIHGNYIKYEYYDNYPYEKPIKRISYTGNDIQNTIPFCEIEFFYATREDNKKPYIGGLQFPQTLILEGIEIKSNGVTIKKYELNYFFDGETKLSKITEFGINGEQLNSTVFEWGESINDVYYPTPNTVANVFSGCYMSNSDLCQGGAYFENFQVGDFNGDGIHDFLKNYTCMIQYDSGATQYDYCTQLDVYIGSANGTIIDNNISLSFDTKAEVFIGDFNYNGKEGFLVVFNLSDNLDQYLTNGYYYELDENNDLILASVLNQEDIRRQYLAGNFSGNGKPSFIEFLDPGSLNAISIDYFNSENNLVRTPVDNPFYNSLLIDFNNPNLINMPPYPLDFDGDGVTDLIGIWSNSGINTVQIWEYNETTSSFIQLCGVQSGVIDPQELSLYPNRYRFGDINGDGKTDLLKYNNSLGNWTYYYFSGHNFTGNQGYFTSTFETSSNYKLYLIDMDGDGRSEIVEYKLSFPNNIPTATVKISYYLGSNNFTSTTYSLNMQGNEIKDLVFGDFNGDNKNDIIYYNSYCQCYKIAYLSYYDKSDYIVEITDGMIVENKFIYSPITKGGTLYSNNTSVDGLLYPVKNGLFVVEQLSRSTGSANINTKYATTDYQYKNGQIHVQGRGFLGFRQTVATNNQTGITIVNENTIDDADYYLVQTVIRKKRNDFYLSTVTTDYINRQQAIEKPYYSITVPSQKVEYDNLLNTYITTNYYYYNQESGDFYANLDSISINYYNDVIEATKFKSYNSEGTWCPNNPSEIIKYRKQGSQNNFAIKSIHTFNNLGKITSTVSDSYPTSGGKSLTASYIYDNFGNLISNTISGNSGPNGLQNRTSSFLYDNNGRFLIRKTNTIGLCEDYSYDNTFGNIISHKDVFNHISTYEYDGFGRTTKTISPTGLETTTVRNWEASVLDNRAYSIYTIPQGKPTTKIWYDILGRDVMSKGNLYDQIVYTQKEYLPNGLIDKESLPYFEGNTNLNWKTYSYDDFYRLSGISSLGLTTSYSYQNTTTEITKPDGTVISQVKNAAGQTVQSTENLQSSVTFSYNSNGKPASITANGITTSFSYDLYGNQTVLNEPNAGITQYGYNSFGELVWQLDANGNEFDIFYDNSGRITARECGNNSQFDVYFNYYENGTSKGLLAHEEIRSGTEKDYLYDDYGRISFVSELIDGNEYSYTYNYDELGNMSTMTYPSGFSIENEYDAYGFLIGVYNASNSVPIWRMTGTNKINEMGQVLNYKLGPNNIQTTYTYNSDFELTKIQTGSVFNHEYHFDHESGNLLYREDIIHGNVESFGYDQYNRLTSWWPNGQTEKTAAYDTKGNITYKSDVGAYSYDNTKVNAVTGIQTNTLTTNPLRPQSVTYNPFLKTSSITEIVGSNSLSYNLYYGSGGQRAKTSFYENSMLVKTKIYSGLYEKETTPTGAIRQINYIPASDGIAAVYVTEGGTLQPSANTYYLVKDHLGSIMALIDNNQDAIQEHSYDAWGNLRNVQNWTYSNINNYFLVERGYTGHEMLLNFNLINMNGRMYDPIIGRILSPDNFVKNPESAQDYNRYSYCNNNPLLYTDPSGNTIVRVRGPGGLYIGPQGLLNNFGETSSQEQQFYESDISSESNGVYFYDDFENPEKLFTYTDSDGFVNFIFSRKLSVEVSWIQSSIGNYSHTTYKPQVSDKGYAISRWKIKSGRSLSNNKRNLINQIVIADIVSFDFTMGGAFFLSAANRYSLNINTTGNYQVSLTQTTLGEPSYNDNGWGLGITFSLGVTAHNYIPEDDYNLDLSVMNGTNKEINTPWLSFSRAPHIESMSADMIGKTLSINYMEGRTRTMWTVDNKLFKLFDY